MKEMNSIVAGPWSVRWLPAFLFAGLLACGQVEADNATPGPLAVMHGKILNDVDLDTDSPVRVALVWVQEDDSGGERAVVAQDVEAQMRFPSSFDLPITSLPPEYALWPPDGNGARGTFGDLLAYVDGDGNGRLDLRRDPSKVMPADTFVAALNAPLVYYVENGPTEPYVESYLPDGIPNGFSLVDFTLTPSQDDAVHACWDAGGTDCEALAPAKIMDISTLVTLRLLETPELPFVVCDTVWGDLDGFHFGRVACDQLDAPSCESDLAAAYAMCAISPP